MVEWINLPGLVNYNESLLMMEERVEKVINGSEDETIYLLEHEDVYTAGTSANNKELLGTNHIPVIYTGRGGKFTYHGPGQRVIYPILNLSLKHRKKDIKLYIKNLENWIISTLAQVGIRAYTIPGKIGIWTYELGKPAKIAAIGVRVKKWVTYHGIAVNITTNLENYSGIIPCGINNFPVTSLDRLTAKIDMKEFDSILKKQFEIYFK